MRFVTALGLFLLAGTTPLTAGEVKVTLKGSRASMQRQNQVARAEDFSFLRTTADVNRFADAGRLVPVPGGRDYRVLASWPYARPVVRGFVELLSSGYHESCGERLVVTSLTRPLRSQPGNASPLSVHPAGMAVDLRVSRRGECVRWLEGALLEWEDAGLVDATREYRPPHFHVAVFPEAFAAHLAQRAADSVQLAELARADSSRVAKSAEVLAAITDFSTISALPPIPSLPWPQVLFAVARLLLRV